MSNPIAAAGSNGSTAAAITNSCAPESHAAELNAVLRLHELSNQLVHGGDPRTLYDQMLEVAQEIMHSQFSSMQIAEQRGGMPVLRLLASRGFHPQSARFWEIVEVTGGCTCGVALREGQRHLTPDVETDPGLAGTAHLEEYRRSGIRSVQSTPLLSRTGEVLGMFSTHWSEPYEPTARELRTFDILARQVSDLIDRRHTEQRERALIERAIADKAKFESVFHQSGIFAGILDLEGTMREINDLAAEGCGYTREEVLDRPFWETPWWRGSEDTQKRIRFAIAQARAGEVFREQLPYWLADGSERIVDFAMHPIRDPSGRVILLHPTGIDITDRTRAEEALREADRRKDEFLATLAHELRNPLAPIRAAVGVLKSNAKADTQLTWIRDVIDRQVVHMVRLLDDLLDLNRISRGQTQLLKSRITLASVVETAVETSRPLIEDGEHQLTIELPEQPVYLLADQVRLAQVFSNLLNNAAKYSPKGSHIRLTGARRDGDVVVSVIDTGIGIPAEALPHVFEMFSQVNPARGQGGLGIGLSLVRGLVELHGGSVTAKSEGKGSEFTVRLPEASDRIPENATTPEDATLRAAGPKFRVLVVDDLADNADTLAMLLEVMGHEVRVAYSGESAITAADEFRPDVAMLDLGMPGMNGFETCRRIRATEHGREMVFVAMTGWGQEEDRQRTEEAGFDVHLVKPVDPQVILKLLDTLAAKLSRRMPQPAE